MGSVVEQDPPCVGAGVGVGVGVGVWVEVGVGVGVGVGGYVRYPYLLNFMNKIYWSNNLR